MDSVRGIIKAVGVNSVTLNQDDSARALDPVVIVTINGVPARLSDLQVGDSVVLTSNVTTVAASRDRVFGDPLSRGQADGSESSRGPASPATIGSVNGTTLSLNHPDGSTGSRVVHSVAVITLNGNPIKLSDLRSGDRVVLSDNNPATNVVATR